MALANENSRQAVMRFCTATGADIPRQLSFELIGGGCFGQSGEQVSKVGMGFEAVGFVPRPGKHYLGPRGDIR